MTRRYPPSSYDDDMCLKPPVLLWIAVAYLSRSIALPILLGIGSLAGGSRDIKAFAGGLISVDSLVPSLIATAVLYALMRRAPTASRLVRLIWRHGRLILATSALLDAALTILDVLGRPGEGNDQVGSALLAVGLDLYFLAYVLMARHVRDVFAVFPPAVNSIPR